MTEPMTPTDALAEAIYVASFAGGDGGFDWREDWRKADPETRLYRTRYVRSLNAPEVLAALPSGWRLVGPDDVTVTVERLAAALEDIQGPYGDSALDDYLRRRGRLNVAVAILAALSADKEGDK